LWAGRNIARLCGEPGRVRIIGGTGKGKGRIDADKEEFRKDTGLGLYKLIYFVL
jgi:hypothetical protein